MPNEAKPGAVQLGLLEVRVKAMNNAHSPVGQDQHRRHVGPHGHHQPQDPSPDPHWLPQQCPHEQSLSSERS